MIEYYPDAADIFEVISSKIQLGNVRDFLKKRGVLFVANNRKDIALYVCRMFFGFEDYEELKSYIHEKSNFKKISGIELNTGKDMTDIAEIFASKKGDILNNTDELKIESITCRDEVVEIDISYISKKPGKVDLIRKERREFKIEIKEKDDKKMALVHHKSSEDYTKVIEVITAISKTLGDPNELLPQKIILERLPVHLRIKFFDKLLLYKYDEWYLEDVVSIKIRKGEELEDEEIEETELRGIAEAVLRGDNLRTNEIVKKFERSGYYFSGVTMKLAHKHIPIKILLEVIFKYRPEQPEISIKDSVEVIDGNESPIILPKHQQDLYLTKFWEVFEEIYYGILNEAQVE